MAAPLVQADTLPATWLLPLIIIGVVVQFLWSSIVTVVLYRVSKTDRNVESMQRQLTEASDKLITERFRGISHSVANHAQSFTSSLDAMSSHVKERDAQFTKMLQANPYVDAQLLKAMNALQTEVRDSTVSTKDFDELRREHRAMQERLGRIATVEDMRKLLQENR